MHKLATRAAVAAFVLTYLTCWLSPVTLWFESRSIEVASAGPGEMPVVIEDRSIRWSFYGQYTVAVRRAATQSVAGGCSGGGYVHYQAGLDGVQSYTLAEYADGNPGCGKLGEGSYFVEVCRTVLRPMLGILPPKSRCWYSNIFEIVAVQKVAK